MEAKFQFIFFFSIIFDHSISLDSLTLTFSQTKAEIFIIFFYATTDATTESSKKSGDNCTNFNNTDSQEKSVTMAETKLMYAINELLSTERDYVNDLAILIEVNLLENSLEA
ncbi:hypothetical protein BpHYR1_023787 [Brachionus plicatilis]|uniref:DH domain-containing protein n=1 Tax=Brachionus plicatilis TaxID=10195 RepID=A0A3M7QIB7_BRAPC|nr:hypothetical protein BpHYR1_023787 [Brachionus plicatilis]